jgi:two-component system, sensor histidine kinase and response regulator
LLSSSKSEIEELQKQKDELFALIIHDIKNPVALIKNLVELLRSYDLTATEQHEIIDDIFTTTTRIVSLSQEVSKILALESSALDLNVDTINMNDILSDIARRYEKAAKEKDITIHFKRIDNLPECEIDHIKIDDVLDNLVSNAIKFSFPGGKVQLSVKSANNNIVVDVSDKGQGLSEEDIQKAFKRGAMLSARPTGNEHSSGLGLWIVKRLIEVHKGRVWIKSAVGKGSTFSFSVPIKRPKEEKS